MNDTARTTTGDDVRTPEPPTTRPSPAGTGNTAPPVGGVNDATASDKLPKGALPTAMIMLVAALPPMLDSTIVNIAIDGLARQFGTGLATMQWAVTVYVLALGIAVPFAGWLIRRVDGRTMFMGATVFFLAGSLLSGLAWNVGSLIVFRAVQGLAAGLIMPTLTTLAVGIAGGSQNLGKLMSLIGIPVVFAPIVGPVVGGLIMANLPWHWLFFVNLPVGLVGLALMGWKFPRFPADDRSARLDWPGVALLAVVSGALVYGVTQVVDDGSRTVGVGFLALGAAALAGYVVYGRRRGGRALVPLSMFGSRNFSAAFTSLFLAGFATNGPMLLFPVFFQNVDGLSVITSALWLIPQGLGMLLTRPFFGKWTDRYGARLIVVPSIAVTIAGTLPFAFFDAATPAWLVWAVLLVRGAGVGGFTVPVMADSYVGLAKPLIPAASVATRIIQNVGAAFGSAVLATVVSTVLSSNGGNIADAFHAGFLTSLAFMAVGIAPAMFLTKKTYVGLNVR